LLTARVLASQTLGKNALTLSKVSLKRAFDPGGTFRDISYKVDSLLGNGFCPSLVEMFPRLIHAHGVIDADFLVTYLRLCLLHMSQTFLNAVQTCFRQLTCAIIWSMSNIVVPCLISFIPLIVTVSGWVKAFRARQVESLHPFASTLLAVVTVCAAIPDGAFIYFRLRPVHLPPWQNPEVAFLAWFLLLGPLCMVLGFLAFRKEPKWLFWLLEAASFWLTGLGFLAVAAY